MKSMKVDDVIRILQSYPKDADIFVSYYDSYGENICNPIIEYNEYSNKAYISPGDSMED